MYSFRNGKGGQLVAECMKINNLYKDDVVLLRKGAKASVARQVFVGEEVVVSSSSQQRKEVAAEVVAAWSLDGVLEVGVVVWNLSGVMVGAWGLQVAEDAAGVVWNLNLVAEEVVGALDPRVSRL